VGIIDVAIDRHAAEVGLLSAITPLPGGVALNIGDGAWPALACPWPDQAALDANRPKATSLLPACKLPGACIRSCCQSSDESVPLTATMASRTNVLNAAIAMLIRWRPAVDKILRTFETASLPTPYPVVPLR